MAKYATNASGAMWSLNLVLVTESISGSVVPLTMFKPEFCRVVRFLVFLFFSSSMVGVVTSGENL